MNTISAASELTVTWFSLFPDCEPVFTSTSVVLSSIGLACKTPVYMVAMMAYLFSCWKFTVTSWLVAVVISPNARYQISTPGLFVIRGKSVSSS